MTAPAPIWTAGEVLFTCPKCGEPVVNTYAQPANIVITNHNKYCSPKKKTARQVAQEKRIEAAEEAERDRPDSSWMWSDRTFTGRMLDRRVAFILAARAREEERAIEAMISEGGRP